MNALTIERHERNSPIWRAVREYAEKEIESLRRQNDGDLDPQATSFLRGQIKALKKILVADQDRIEVQISDE